MKIRPCDWINTETLEKIFGVQIKVKGKWCHAHKNGTPLFFNTSKERDIEIKRLKLNEV